mmetsp:Transcript_22739/g.31758  ORF Transcript_22739/g.31758 Transcript_22739/m.31758 type:complete len:253 (+) Transcript_22739:82-840(+)
MKISIAATLLVASTASAFTSIASPRSKLNSFALNSATAQNGKWSDDYSAYPLHEPKNTTPEPVKPAGIFGRKAVPDITLDPDYYLTWCFAIVGALITWYHPSYAVDGTPSLIGIAGGGFHILFAALLYSQTSRVRCRFEKDGFEFYNVKGVGEDAELIKKPDNYVSGTRNRWSYDKIIHYDFFPSLEYPVICYFKETETPKEQWSKWFAAFDSYGRGQPHFFPGLCNARQFKNQMELRGVKRKPLPSQKTQK